MSGKDREIEGMIGKIGIGHTEDIAVVLLRLSATEQDDIEETMIAMANIERGTVTVTDRTAVITSHQRKTDEKETGDIPDDGETGLPRNRDPAAAPHAETEAPTAVIPEEEIANPTTILARALAHRNSAGPGLQDTQTPRLVVLAPNQPLNVTEFPFQPKSRPRQRNPILSKISWGHFLPAKTKPPSVLADEAPTNPI